MPNENFVIASTWRRIGGGICDFMIFFIFIAICGSLGLGDLSIENTKASVSMSGWPFFIVSLLYALCLAYMEYKTAKTPGKYLTRTKVLGENYQKISFFQALLRNVLRLLDEFGFCLIGLVLIICTKENQRLGDLIAKTYVVED